MTNSNSFVHLHVHSEFSLLESSLRIKAMTKKAKEFGMPAVALTDHGNMFGAVEFYFSALEQGIKPILGLDVYMAPQGRFVKSQDRDSIFKPNTKLVLLAQNFSGYQALCRLSSIGYHEGFYYKPRVDYEVLAEHSENLICLTGGLQGDVVHTFLKEGPEAAKLKLTKLQEIFKDKLFIEINRTGIKAWAEAEAFLISQAKAMNLPLVAANDVHYLKREDQIVQDVLVCIGANRTLSDENRPKLGSDQFYFKSPEEMRSLFKDLPEALDNTLKIADMCNLKFKLKDENGKQIYHLPSFPTVEGKSLKEEIKDRAFRGLKVRIDETEKRGEKISDLKYYEDRLNYELKVIDSMGFNGYFLIVQDFINWAKTNGIPVGPGRGSGAGSLVAYSLNITDLDPVPYNLLFERFLNPERISMPDFDIDFCQDRRGEVIQYVTEHYGAQSVSQIITYGKLQTRAAIKDVGRVLGMIFSDVDVVTKLIPDKLNITISEALEMEPRLRELIELNPQIGTLIELAQKVEGLNRHAGIHAAGVVIADGSLVDHAPLYRGPEGENVVQYDMKHAEKIGLIKFDFLGLKTLTHIQNALNIIKRNKNIEIKANEISINDPGIYEIMCKGDTAGIFQFEGDGITDAIRKIKPSTFTDITAINALYRPGPMAMIPDFAKRKNGESPVEYVLEDLKEILEETYGIIVYQEQVMAIASKIAGYSLGEADMLRRAMGKKIKEEMDSHRKRFLTGAAQKGHDPKKSEEIFDLMYKFADYGFNKSHAAAYCVIAAQTAYLKFYYPAEFFAALLSTELGDTDKVVKYVKDAQRRGLVMRPPHVNFSDFKFTAVGEEIYFGLGAIKGIGESTIEAILEARQQLPNQKFEKLSDFFEHVDSKKLNKKSLESLIKAGALDGFGYHRAQLIEGYPRLLEAHVEKRKDKEIGQASLFEMMEDQEAELDIPQTKQWTRTQFLAAEKDVLGFYLSDHPLKGFENLMKVWTTSPIDNLKSIPLPPAGSQAKPRAIVAGILTELKEVITKKGTRMAFGRLEDLTGSCELVLFPDVYAKFEAVLKKESPLLIGGLFEGAENPKIIVDTMMLFEQAFEKAKSLRVNLTGLSQDDFAALVQVFGEHPGPTKVELRLKLLDLGQEVEFDSDEVKSVQMSPELFETLHHKLGRTDFIEVRT